MRRILSIIFIINLVFIPAAFAKKREKIIIPEGSGYVGTLPSLEEPFINSKTEESKPIFDYQDGFNDPDAIKSAPRDNTSFINIIMKKDKTSKYVNDLNELITIIENLQDVVEAKESIQLFNAKAYFLKENVEYFRNKYKDAAEESYISYKRVLSLNNHVQTIARLRYESEVYSPFVTSEQNGNMFSQNSINNQLNYLLEDIEETLVILKDTK